MKLRLSWFCYEVDTTKFDLRSLLPSFPRNRTFGLGSEKPLHEAGFFGGARPMTGVQLTIIIQLRWTRGGCFGSARLLAPSLSQQMLTKIVRLANHMRSRRSKGVTAFRSSTRRIGFFSALSTPMYLNYD